MEEEKSRGIQVYLRIRPTKTPSGYFSQNVLDGENVVEFSIPNDADKTYVNNTRTNYKFKFDGVIQQKDKQDRVFNVVARSAIESCLQGFNACIFAYGQTGSGKTFTITGGAERYVDRGIIPRSLSYIYGKIAQDSEIQYTVRVSYLEIYNDNGYDLLNPGHDQGFENIPKVQMKEDEYGNINFTNLKTHLASTEEDALNLLFIGDTNRAIAETPMNLASSRSHCIFTIFLEAREEGSEIIRRSKLHLVDLAGSERVHKTNSGGQILREAKYINSSLHFLEMVIVALHERNTKGRQHIPYRNSLMTSVLRDSLGGNCITSMIATVSAEKSETEETISTCRFAQRVALIKNVATVNEELDPSMMIERLKGQISSLKEENAMLKDGRTDNYAVDDEELEELRSLVKEWLSKAPQVEGAENKPDLHSLLNPGELSYDRIHTCFNLLKTQFYRSGSQATSRVSTTNSSHKSLLEQLKQREAKIAELQAALKRHGLLEDRDVSEETKPETLEEDTDTMALFEKMKRKKADSRSPALTEVPEDVLSDRKSALEYFKRRYPQSRSINDNAKLLREKYKEAKQTGDRVNRARQEMLQLKADIERIRKQNAIRDLDEAKEGEEEGKYSGQIDPQEEALTKEMSKQKHIYNSNYRHLREQKNEIMQVRNLLDRGMVKLQEDFEEWFAKVQTENRTDEEKSSREEIPQSPLKTQRPVGHASQESKTQEAYISNNDVEDENDTFTKKHGVKLSGNPEADAEIVAFYRAREKLLHKQ